MRNRVANTISTIFSKRAVLAGAFLAAVVVAVPMFFVIADSSPGGDDLSPVPARWQIVSQIEYQQNDPDITLATRQETSWTVPVGGIVGVDVLGHTDNGGYCYAYWGGSNPGWVAEYQEDGQTGIYTVDGTRHDGPLFGGDYCPIYPPTFDALGNANICLPYRAGTDGRFSYGANYLGETRGDIPNTFIPGGTTINLQARHAIGSSVDYVHCYLAVKQYSSSEYFPSTSNPHSGELTLNQGGADRTCRDGEYMAGLNRSTSGGNSSFQIYCAPSPDPDNLIFPSATNYTANALPISGFAQTGTSTCSSGFYMSGLSVSNSGLEERTRVFCSPAPAEYASQFINTNLDNSTLPGFMWGLGLCPDGYYMSGLGRQSSGDIDRTKVLCSPAPALPADFGESCDIAPFNRPCGFGFECNSSNICDVPARPSCNLNLSGPEWTARYKPESGGPAYGYATAVDSSDNVYETGEALNAVSATSGMDLFLRKYNGSGGLQWEKFYDNNSNESGYGVVADNLGGVYAVGREQGVSENNIGIVRKYDNAGNLVWNQALAGRADVLKGVTVDGAGNVYVTGYRISAGNSDMIIMRLVSADGALSWLNSYNDINYNESGYSVAMSPDNSSVYVTGYQSINGGDAFVQKYNSSWGWLLWTQMYNSGGNQTDIGRSVSVNAGGDVYVAGYQSTNGGDMFFQAYDTDGNLKWEETYNSGGQNNDVGRAVVTGGSGRVYVAGSQKTSTNNDDVFLKEYFSSDYKAFLQNTLISNLSYQDIAYGIDINSSDELYVSGYQSINGGEAFLNKYSCIASASGGAVTASGEWATLSVTPGTDGNAPFTITATGAVTIPDPVAYTWDWGDGETSTGQIATHTYRNTTCATTCADIPRLLTLTVQNLVITSETDIATTTITVRPDTAPIAGFTVTPSTGAAPLLVRVNSTSTDTLPGKIISYNWNWDDGTAPGNGVQTSHVYTNAGTYTITLAVTDDGGMPTSTASRIITVTWACTTGTGPGGSCAAPDPVCAPGNQCVQCLADYDCGVGSRCTGISCKQGDLCPDGNDCPIDGKCAEPASDSSSVKNTCVLASDSLGASCYIEEIPSSCANDLGCIDSAMGGICDITNSVCRYARCLNESSKTCAKDSDCAGGDGICDAGVCKYIYDCAYGPGMSSGAVGRYEIATPPIMPAMPIGPQPEGQACTQPTPDAPINCEGINGCLYYNFNADGNPVQNSNSSVANCLDKFNGGTGCVYYQRNGTTTANCLASSDGIAGAKKRTVCIPGDICADGQICPASATCLATPVTAGIPDGCIQVAKGKDSKGNIKYDYNCSNIDGCYYKSDGGMDCTYTIGSQDVCVNSSQCTSKPYAIGDCDLTNNLCDYHGNGCIYEPNPEGAIFCPGATRPATGGENYVQCLLNPDATLPWYLQDRTATTTPACKTNADCPAGNICLDGACYPECQVQTCDPDAQGATCPDGSSCPLDGICPSTPENSISCATGQQCFPTCDTVYDCPSDSYICNAGVCIPPPICAPGTYCPSGDPCPLNGQCPTTPLCFGAQPRGNLPFGTDTTPISMQTTQDATCRYSLIEDTPYGVMTETFNITGSTAHSEDVSGLMPLPSINTYFVECQSVSGDITPACRIEFGVGEPCSEDSQCDGGLSCINGYCQLPYCDGAQPPAGTSLPSDTSSVDIGLNTDNAAACRYSQTLPNSLFSRLDQYLGMPTLFSTIDGITHTDTVISNLVTGNNRYYALCQENDPPQNVAPLCQISFNIGVCNEEFKCANGWQCEPNTGNGICIPPACSNVSVFSEPGLLPPDLNNSFSATTTAVTMNATTDETANCAYADNRYTAFSDMTGFALTGGLAHTADNVSVNGGYNTKYVKCQDADGGDVCSVSFRVGIDCGINGVCPGGLECRNGTCLAPICANAYPTNVPVGTTATTMGLDTDIDTECRYSKTTYDFNSMAVFNNTGGQTHSTDVTDLAPRLNRYIVGCRENALPNTIKNCVIPITVGSCSASPGACEIGFGCNVITDTCVDCDTNPELPECQPWCVRFPWLCNQNPQCTPGVDCPIDIEPPIEGASCSFMGITFFGDAVDDDGTCDILAMILAVISWMAWLVALLAVLSGLRAAYLYITAMGNEKRLILARSYLIYTTIGVVVAILSFGIVAIVRALMGI